MSVSFIATLTAVLILGDHTIGIFFAASGDIRLLIAVQAGRRNDHRPLELHHAMRNDRHRRIRHGEVDHHVGIRFANNAQRNADLANARDQARVFAQQRMIGRLQCRDNLKARILRRQRGDPLPHPSRRYRESRVSCPYVTDHLAAASRRRLLSNRHLIRPIWPGYLLDQLFNSIARTISSRSFATCTARLAKAARFTPRLPSTSLNSS